MLLTWRFARLAVLLALSYIFSALAQTPAPLSITGVTVIDTINGRALPNRTVTIRDRAIMSITPGDSPAREADALMRVGKPTGWLVPEGLRARPGGDRREVERRQVRGGQSPIELGEDQEPRIFSGESRTELFDPVSTR